MVLYNNTLYFTTVTNFSFYQNYIFSVDSNEEE